MDRVVARERNALTVEKNVRKGKKVENCLYLCGNRVKDINNYGHIHWQLPIET